MIRHELVEGNKYIVRALDNKNNVFLGLWWRNFMQDDHPDGGDGCTMSQQALEDAGYEWIKVNSDLLFEQAEQEQAERALDRTIDACGYCTYYGQYGDFPFTSKKLNWTVCEKHRKLYPNVKRSKDAA